jgi:pyruvate formate lyase activating enzyme
MAFEGSRGESSPGEDSVQGIVFNVQRYSTEDGPGIRTTVFLKGCPMSCPWCHNPEGMDPRPELVWYEARCVGVRECLRVCPREALTLTPEGMVIARDRCDACGACVEACPAAALEVIGRKVSAILLAEEAARDETFFRRSGGGVTLSGGEPALQAAFCLALMEILAKKRIPVALDTCGGVAWSKLEPLARRADLVLYDLKVMDEAKHREYTGVSLSLVLDNAVRIAELGVPMWVRTPVIPGYTEDVENIRAVARFIRENLPTVERFDLLAFNNTCRDKYRRLDRIFPLAGQGLLERTKMEALVEAARQEGVESVCWSGAVAGK